MKGCKRTCVYVSVLGVVPYIQRVATYYPCHSGLDVGLAHKNLGPNPDALRQVFWSSRIPLHALKGICVTRVPLLRGRINAEQGHGSWSLATWSII